MKLAVEDFGLWNWSFEGSNMLCWEKDRGFIGLGPNIELPKTDEGGGPAGVNEPVDDGGGPAGVVEGFVAPKEKLWPDLLSGVDGGDGGGLEENGTWKPDMSSS